MKIYAQVNRQTNQIEQFVGFNGEPSAMAHKAVNPQAFFVETVEFGSPWTHGYDPATGKIFRKPEEPPKPITYYGELRRRAYPSIGNQLDALWKLVAQLSQTQPLPPEAQQVLDKIQEVKSLHPKPAGLDR